MPAATDKAVSKTAFLKEFLEKNPKATTALVNEAWTKAGNPGKVSQTLVGKLRTQLGLAGNIRNTRRTVESNGAPTAAKKPSATTAKPTLGTSRDRTTPKAKAGVGSRGKSGFIKEVLFDNPLANSEAVNKAWKAAGMSGTVSNSLVSKLRSELGLSGNIGRGSRKASRKTGGAKFGASPKRVQRVAGRDRILAEVEGEIDRLIFKLLAVDGMTKAEDALRAARRIIVRSHEG
jgi:hypothetical protein